MEIKKDGAISLEKIIHTIFDPKSIAQKSLKIILEMTELCTHCLLLHCFNNNVINLFTEYIDTILL